MGIVEKAKGLGTKTLALIAAFAIVATAATVAYLSQAASMTATVQSPFEILITSASQGTVGADGLSVNLGNIYGGSTFSVVGTLENKANNPVHAATKITCTDGASTIDCSQVSINHNVTVVAGPATGYVHDDGALPCAVSGGNAVFTVQSGYDFPAGHKSVDQFDATVVPAYSGSLSCSIQALPS